MAQQCLRLTGRRRDRAARHRPRADRRDHPGPHPARRPRTPGGRPLHRPDPAGRAPGPAGGLSGQRTRVHGRHGGAGGRRHGLGRRRGHPDRGGAEPHPDDPGRPRGRPPGPRGAVGRSAGRGLRHAAGPPPASAPYGVRAHLLHPAGRRTGAGAARQRAAACPRVTRAPGAALRGGPLPPALLLGTAAAPAHRSVDRRLGHGVVRSLHHERQPQPPDRLSRGSRPPRGHRGPCGPRPRAVGGLAGQRPRALRG